MPNVVPAQTAIGPTLGAPAAPASSAPDGRTGKAATFAALLGQTDAGHADPAAQPGTGPALVPGAQPRGDAAAAGNAAQPKGLVVEPPEVVPQDVAGAVAPPPAAAVHPPALPVPTAAATPAPAAGPRGNARRDGAAKPADADPPRAGQPAATPVEAPGALAASVPADPPPAPEPQEIAADPAGSVGPPTPRPGRPAPTTLAAEGPSPGATPAPRDAAATPGAAAAALPEVSAPAIIQGLDAAASPPRAERTNLVAVAAAGTTATPGNTDAAGPSATIWPPRSGGTQHLHVDLRDDALGMVHVEVGPQKDGMSAVLHVDKPELLAALVDSRDQLGRALDAAGAPAAHHAISFVASESRDAGNADSGQPGPGQRGAPGQDSAGGASGGAGTGGSAATGLGSTWQQGGGHQNHAAYRPAARGYAESTPAIEEFLPTDVQAVRGRLTVDSVDMIV